LNNGCDKLFPSFDQIEIPLSHWRTVGAEMELNF